MSTDPRHALNHLIEAFEHHLDVACAQDRLDERALEQAESALRDAFFLYDDVLFRRFDVELPFDMYEGDEEYDEEDEENDDELDDEDFDDSEDLDIYDMDID
ncbi:DNA primase [Schaalia sp. lx-100]|uniref:DNA primase n=1 Tax=Schaalia sp. lx-100 TaxID=2899081 RepID=UPI001E2B16FD|nr:DNA primase [Schaalia sp. lx-100]MCD4558157.1 DNA primase [Schaalia sp. lx-100]